MKSISVDVLQGLPPVDEAAVDQQLAKALSAFQRKIVVLDDDPTGVQTVHGISVYTDWSPETFADGFAAPESMFFILTNSRAMTRSQTRRAHQQMAEGLTAAADAQGKDYVLISRSDSTMRGHFPLETEVLRATIEGCSDKRFAGEIIVPFFQEGGRLTIDNIHYVRDGDQLVPAGATEFAKDKSFGYASSHIGDYVEEKTQGRYTREHCTYISLDDLRALRVDSIAEQLQQVQDFNKVIVNAVEYVDIKVFVLALLQAMEQGKEFMFRSAAAVTRVLGGIQPKPLLTREHLRESASRRGGLVIIGSHVNKTTQQYEHLRTSGLPLQFLEFDQHRVTEEGGLQREVQRVVKEVEEHIAVGQSAVVCTRRERYDPDTYDEDEQLRVSQAISDAVMSIVAQLSVRPGFIIAKGGVTSSDVGTKALQVRRALVMGQIRPGIPVWLTGEESKFPQLPFVIFPGNVGGEETLTDIVQELL